MTVNVWPSKLRTDFAGNECEPIEQHETAAEMTIEAWLLAKVRTYRPLGAPPISVHVNGELVSPPDWAARAFSPSDRVDIYPEPKGAEVAAFLVSYGAYILAGIALLAVVLMPKPATPKNQGQTRGNSLEESTAKGNKVKINSVIRESCGRRKIYPDYLLPPHRYFSSPTQQTVRMLLCIGKGEFDISAGDVLIGDTPAQSLGDGVDYAIYGPGASLAGDTSVEWWHSASEVGPTSVGSSGIELNATTGSSSYSLSEVHIFSGDTITIPEGAGYWPADWEVGQIIRTDPEYSYTVTDGGGSRDIISGDLSQLAPFVGMEIEIAGDNAGRYVVHTFTAGTPDQMTLNYSDGSPVRALKPGGASMAIGPAGLQYQIISNDGLILTVERLTSAGAIDATWPGFTSLTSYDALVQLVQGDVDSGWAGPFAACPDGEVTDTLEFDVFFPAGLIGIDKKGRSYEVGVEVELQYRDIAAGGAWTSVSKSYVAATLNQLGFTEIIELGASFRPEVRMRRVTASENSTRIQDEVQWYGLRALLAGPSSYGGVTTIALRVDGGNKLAAQSESQVSVIATRKLPVLVDGAWSAATTTRSISAFFAYVAKSIGYTDDDIDLEELERLDGIWSARGDTLDMVVESPSTAKAVLNNSLRAGFAEFTVDRGRLRPVRDETRSAFEQMYTPQNMTRALVRQFQAAGVNDFDGVDVEYVNGTSWAVETVQCRLPGDIGRKVEKISLEGVTSRTRAWRIGMRQRRVSKYRRKSYKFDTELDALNSQYLSYCALADDVPGYAQSAILLSYADGVLRSSEPLDWSAGGAHVVAIRKPDGSLSGPYAATQIDDYRLSITGLDFTPDTSWEIEPPHLLFGPLTRWNYPSLIVAISPSRDGVSVDAVNYDARVYADDDNAPD